MFTKFFHASLVIIILLSNLALVGGASGSPTLAPQPTSTPQPLELTVSLASTVQRTDFPLNGALEFIFNQPVDPASATPAVLTYPWIEGDETWDAEQTHLTFQPRQLLAAQQTYYIYINTGLVGRSGGQLTTAPTWTLLTGRGPQVIKRTPSAPTPQDLTPLITLEFDRAMDPASLTAALSVQPTVTYTTSWQAADNRLAIQIVEPLTPGVRYSFVLSRAAVDTTGLPLAEYAWDYGLPAFQVAVASLAADQLDQPLSLGFTYAVAPTATLAALVVTPTLDFTATWPSPTVLQLHHPQTLTFTTVYTFSFSGTLTTPAGLPLPPLAPATFTPPSPILYVDPPSDDRYYYTDLIEVYFAVPVDHASAEAAFSLSPQVDGEFSWRDNTLVYTVDGWVQDVFTATIQTSLRDPAGRPLLREPYTWRFKLYFEVYGQAGESSFGVYGSNIQVVSTAGRRAVQFSGLQNEIGKMRFVLYQYAELGDFVQAYAESFGSGWEHKSIDTAALAEISSWTYVAGDTIGSVRETFIPQDTPPGLYVLNLKVAGEVVDQLFIVLSANLVVAKRAGDRLYAWVADADGQAVPEIEVRVYNQRGESIREGQADENGWYATTVYGASPAMLVVARTAENDFAVTGLTSAWGGYYRAQKSYLVYPYTDRPIYRPGQTVNFKAIIRQDDDVKYNLPPAGAPVIVRVRDGRDNVLQTFTLTANAFGSVNGSFQLSEGGMLGQYTLEVEVAGESTRQIFKVQDYRKPDILVTVRADESIYANGQTISLTVTASYFFGEPVANAAITLSSYYLYCGYDCSQASSDYEWYRTYGNPLSGRTDAQGRWQVKLPVNYNDYQYGGYDWRSSLRTNYRGLEATVDDGSGQLVSGFVVVEVANAAEKINMDYGSYLRKAGVPFDVHVSVVNLAGQPVADRSLKLELRSWANWNYETIISATSLTTDAAGQAVASLTPAQTGYYQMLLVGQDGRGNPMEYERWLYVYDDANTWTNRSTADNLNLTAVKTDYRPGEMAEFIIESNFNGPALLTFERGSINRVKLVQLTAPVTRLSVEIIPEDAPNIYVTLSAWQAKDTHLPKCDSDEEWRCWYIASLADQTLLRDSVELQVDASSKLLNVAIAADQASYAPGASATFTVTVTNPQGQPVQAELSLALVDEAIYSLSAELAPNIFAAFYSRRYNTVSTYNSMYPYRILVNNQGGQGGGGGDGGPGGVRSDFPDTALWLPVVLTDHQGRAVVTLTLPDNLTTWRLTVKAFNTTTRVGEAIFKIQTHKPVIVRPLLPRTLTAGDTVQLVSALHNYSASQLDLMAILDLQGVAVQVSSPLTQTVTLAPGEVRLLSWTVTVQEAGAAQVLVSVQPVLRAAAASAEVQALSDAVLLPLTIHPLAIPEVTSQLGAFTGGFTTTVYLPANALPMSTVQLDLSHSLAANLLDGLDYLTGYPYGCVEQTMSRALPNAVIGRAFTELGVDPGRKEALTPLVRAGLQRLYGYQHNDGGWGWWFDDATHDYQTAWVVFGLSVTKQAGFEVDDSVIDRGSQWLEKNLAKMDERTRAYALYSLAVAGYGDLAATQTLAGRAYALDTASQAELALALHTLGDHTGAQALLDRLAEAAVRRGDYVYWPQPHEDGHYYEKTMASTTRSTALALQAFIAIRPDHPFTPGIVAWLLSQRRINGWGSTNETAYTILALTDHLVAARAAARVSLTITLNGRELVSDTLAAHGPAYRLVISATQLAAGPNLLAVRTTSAAKLYYRVTQRAYLGVAEVPAAGMIGLTRRYVDPKTGATLTSVQVGQLVKVVLAIDIPQEGNFMILEDRLPGGLEALNESLNNTSHEAGVSEWYGDEYFYRWSSLGYNNKEIHADRVSFFITNLLKGSHTYSYLARATQAGTFTALPAEAYAMYDASLWGRSASAQMTVNGK